jgi:fatty acid desaturase
VNLAHRAARYGRINLALLALMAVATTGALFGVPFLLEIDAHFAWLLLPVALLTNSFWSLHHEAIHGSFHANRRINLLAGRSMAILLGSSFHVLRFAHLMHHRFNRNPGDRPDVYDPSVASKATARLGFLGNLVIGLYLSELISPLLCLLPRFAIRRILALIYRGEDPATVEIRRTGHRLFLDPKQLRSIRADALLSLALLMAAALAFGKNWPLLVAFLAGRGALISIFDNVYHFATPIDRPDYARNLALPRVLQLLFLNMNLHRVHHGRPSLPWWALPAQLKADGDRCDAPMLRAALLQFTGPVALSDLQTASCPGLTRTSRAGGTGSAGHARG